jgi:hypothetical protein
MRLRAGGVGRATCQGSGEPEHQPQPHSSLPSFFPAFAQGEVSQAIRRIVEALCLKSPDPGPKLGGSGTCSSRLPFAQIIRHRRMRHGANAYEEMSLELPQPRASAAQRYFGW